MVNVFDYLKESAEKHSQKVFIKSSAGEWSYNQVYKGARAVSKYLVNSGIKKGDRVVLFCGNSVQYVQAFFGIMAAYAIAVPINPVKLYDSVSYIIKKSSPKLIFYSDPSYERLNKIDSSVSIEKINIDSVAESLNSMQCEPDVCGEASDCALILFTSGTTCHPKGVALSHENLISNTTAINEFLQLSDRDSILMTLPFSYSYGNSILLTHASAGASLVLENATAYPYTVLEGIRKHKVSGFSTVGSYIHLMIKYVEGLKENPEYFKFLRYITFAGESTDYSNISYITNKYPGIRIFMMYGQTEASARLSYLNPELLHVKRGSIGRGLKNTELKVVNESGEQVQPGETGEILARGPGIMKTYWEDPDETREVIKEGWLHTGDIATVDEDGYIYIRGRKTDMIKFMGHRISPLEIENIINQNPDVKESAVVECSLNGMQCIKAFLVLKKGNAADEIKQSVCARLPMYMRPQIFETVKELPRTDNGKIKRSELRSKCVE